MLLLNCLFFLSAILITNGFVTESKSNDILPANSEKVTVQVYYECLCPGCKQFHTTALPDVYHKIGDYLDLKTYPYGNAKRHHDDNGKIVFECQHGKAECYGNKLHACAIDLLPEKQAMDLITCMMGDRWDDRGSTNKDMKHSAKSEKVTVQVYYESLCPGCKQFHTRALPDVYHRLGPYLELKTYPYGNARRHDDGNGNIQFQCQHGKAECYGNKLHACAIALWPEETAIDLITCMMGDRWHDGGSSNEDMKHCARELKINVDEIIECANGSKGDELLDYYGRETDKVPDRQFVPWVLINGDYCDIEKLDFMTEVCKAFTDAPPGCG